MMLPSDATMQPYNPLWISMMSVLCQTPIAPSGAPLRS